MKMRSAVLGLCVAAALSALPVLADPVVYIDLDTEAPGIQSTRTAVVGETFKIYLVLTDDGNGTGTTTFDTVILGVYFNDVKPSVLGVTSTAFPHAGDLAANSETVIDAFSKQPIKPGGEMALTSAQGTFVTARTTGRPYLSTAGRAGLIALGKPFSISASQAPAIFAEGKLNAGFRSLATGTSSIIAAGPGGNAEMSLNGQPIRARLVPGVVTVVPPNTTVQPHNDPANYQGTTSPNGNN